MMSYVNKVLQPGEEIRYRASRHWVAYVPGLALHLLAGILWIAAPSSEPWKSIVFLIAGLSAAAALILIVQAWFKWWITEIAVTNRRIIYKTGFIRRETNEMHMDKVESVRVDQSILGRLLDYGDVNILGTGEGFEPLKGIDAPLELRNHITGV
jgi:uncharacterized membrane protein YdbT with pleckstrin-like domain